MMRLRSLRRLIQARSWHVPIVAYILRRCYRYVTEVVYTGLERVVGRWRTRMINVCIEVDSGKVSPTTLFVKADSILRALEVAEDRTLVAF